MKICVKYHRNIQFLKEIDKNHNIFEETGVTFWKMLPNVYIIHNLTLYTYI